MQRKFNREVGLLPLLFVAVGSVIGSGWLLGALTAATIAGPASLLSWLIGAVAVLLIAFVYAELGGMFPVAGGGGRFPHYSFGSMIGFSSSWFAFLGTVTTPPIEAEAAIQYAHNYIPGLEVSSGLTPLGIVVGIILLLVFAGINLLGIRWLASINKWVMYWKIAVPVLTVIVFLIVAHNFSNFGAGGGFFAKGYPAILSAVSTGGIVFAYQGFEQAVQFGAESRNPKRNIPLAVIGAVLLGVVLYIGLELAFVAALKPSALAHGWTITAFASASFGPYAALASGLGLGWLAVILYIDAVVSPAGTGLVYTGSATRLVFGMARNRYLPGFFAFLSDRRAPVIAVIASAICGIIFFLPFPNWATLVGLVTSATVLTYGLQPLTLAAMRRQIPNQERPFRLPAMVVLAPLTFIVANEIILFTGWTTVWKLMVGIVVGFVIMAVCVLLSPADRRPRLDLASGIWLIPYLIGMTLISFASEKAFGGTNFFRFGVDIGVMAVFSLVIYFVAVAMRLPNDRAADYVHVLGAEQEAEDDEIALTDVAEVAR
jgi:amino acid transporter